MRIQEPSRAPSPTPTSSESGRSGVSRKPTRPIRVSPRKKPTARPIRGLSARASTQTLRSSAFDRELSHKRSNMSMAEPQASDADDDEGGDDQVRLFSPVFTCQILIFSMVRRWTG